MKKLSCWSFRRFVLPSVMIGLVLSAAGVARASFLYTFTATSGPIGSAQFSENSILTAPTTITTFSSDTFSGLESLTIAPESGQTCIETPVLGPCVADTLSSFNGETFFYFFSSNLTSTGTFTATGTNLNNGTLQISQVGAVPEPSAFLLTGLVLVVGLWVARKEVFTQSSELPA